MTMKDSRGLFNTLRATNVPTHSYTDTGLNFSCCVCQC